MDISNDLEAQLAVEVSRRRNAEARSENQRLINRDLIAQLLRQSAELRKLNEVIERRNRTRLRDRVFIAQIRERVNELVLVGYLSAGVARGITCQHPAAQDRDFQAIQDRWRDEPVDPREDERTPVL